jgi:hypothetical protein
MDEIIIGISNAALWATNTYYEVFNWGDGVPDTNSNLGDVAGPEDDNQSIPESEFYGPPPAPDGILIDVDTADSNPPAGAYDLVIIISPPNPAPTPPGSDGTTQVDSIEVTEVPIPP